MTSRKKRETRPFELCFWGGWTDPWEEWPRYRRKNRTYEDAEDEAYRVLALLNNRGAHPAIIYGPGCGADGITIP